MRPHFRSSLLGACALTLLLTTPALAAEEFVAIGKTLPSVQLLGWSADEQRYAIRVYAHVNPMDQFEMLSDEDQKTAEEAQAYNESRIDKDGFCKGYVDHQGKRFQGELRFVVYEGNKKVASLPIQEQPRCTAPADAASKLAEAKKRLAELGIDLSRPGHDHPLVSGKRVAVKPEKQPPYAVEFVNKVKDVATDEEDGVLGRIRGTLELYVHRGGKKEKALTRKVEKEFELGMGGAYEEKLSSVHVSPSGARAVVLGYVREGSARGGFTSSLRIEKLLGWPEGAIAAEK